MLWVKRVQRRQEIKGEKKMRSLLERLENKTGQLLESQVAKTILQQMGGEGRVKAMTGAKHIMKDDKSVSFEFSKGRKKLNYVKITLTPSTFLYEIEFGRMSKERTKSSAKDKATTNVKRGFYKAKGVMIPQGYEYEKLKTIKGVYADQLIKIIEREAGL